MPCVSSQARTQREQTMHRSGLKSKYGLLMSGVAPRWLAPFAVARVRDARIGRHVLQLAVAVRRAVVAVERMVGDVELDDAAAQLRELGELRA